LAYFKYRRRRNKLIENQRNNWYLFFKFIKCNSIVNILLI
jgi:hypothetical protein